VAAHCVSYHQSTRYEHTRGGRVRAGRPAGGQSIIELGVVLIVAVPAILLLVDCAFLVIGAATNDAVCRDVARAASSGPPGLLEVGEGRSVSAGGAPYQRALAVLNQVWITNMPMKVRDTVSISETITDVPPETTGGAISGSVTVETTIDVFPVFLAGGVVASGSIPMTSRHTVPYTYVAPRPAS